MESKLEGQVAIVAGGTRGAGRGICVALGAAGAVVYATGRTTRTQRSPVGRAETIEETAEMVEAAGGHGIAVRVDHSDLAQVETFFKRVEEEQDGKLDVLVNDVWGGDSFATWDTPFWEHSLEDGLALLRQAVETHIITSHYAAPLMIRRKRGLIVEITDGTSEGYRGNLFYDLAKASVIRLALAQSEELWNHNIAALALTPGFLRSEAVLEHFGVSEENWRDAVEQDPYFAASESPTFIGRAVVALASDQNIRRRSGGIFSTRQLAEEYDFTDKDGATPDWGSNFPREVPRSQLPGLRHLPDLEDLPVR